MYNIKHMEIYSQQTEVYRLTQSLLQSCSPWSTGDTEDTSLQWMLGGAAVCWKVMRMSIRAEAMWSGLCVNCRIVVAMKESDQRRALQPSNSAGWEKMQGLLDHPSIDSFPITVYEDLVRMTSRSAEKVRTNINVRKKMSKKNPKNSQRMHG